MNKKIKEIDKALDDYRSICMEYDNELPKADGMKLADLRRKKELAAQRIQRLIDEN